MPNYLCLPGWETDEPTIDGEAKTATITATYTRRPDHCPVCGVVGAKLYKHQPRTANYKDLPLFGMQVTIIVKFDRLKCRECGNTFTPHLPDMYPGSQLTVRCAKHLLAQGNAKTYALLSRDTGIDESVIRRICNEQNRTMDAPVRPQAPEVLGIDELTLDGELRFIAIDVKAKRILDLREECSTNVIETWLFLMRDKGATKIVAMDMRDQYRQIVQRILPGAIIVVDRWHIQSKANKALDYVRSRHKKIEVAKDQRRREAEFARTGKWPKKRKRKEPQVLRRMLQQGRKKHKPQTVLELDGYLKNNPLIADAWQTKESFYDIWDAKTRAEAERKFDEWRKSIPRSVKKEFDAVADTVDNWHTEVFAYFDHKYTNALTEAINGLIKQVNRAGRGYKFPNIRAKALHLQIGQHRKAQRARQFTCDNCLGVFSKDTDLPDLELPFEDGYLLPPGIMMICRSCMERLHKLGEAGWIIHDRISTNLNG